MISLGLTVFSWGMIFVAAAITWMVGMVFYSPLMFGKRWVALSNVRMDGSNAMFACMAFDFVTLFMQAYVCAWLLENFEAWTFIDAYIVVGVIAFVCGVLPLVAITAWERRSWELFVIHAAGIMIAFLLITSILLYVAF